MRILSSLLLALAVSSFASTASEVASQEQAEIKALRKATRELRKQDTAYQRIALERARARFQAEQAILAQQGK